MGEGSWRLQLDICPTKTFVALHQHYHHRTHCSYSPCHLHYLSRDNTFKLSPTQRQIYVAQLNCSASTHSPIWHKASGEIGLFSSNLLLSSLQIIWLLSIRSFGSLCSFIFKLVSALFQLCFLLTDYAFLYFKWKKLIKCEYVSHWAKLSVAEQDGLEICLNEILIIIFIIKRHISIYWNLTLILHFIYLTEKVAFSLATKH